ncbi:MAG: pyruvate, water dikinase regulatory protein [Candidatus Melainabacteria bacterium]|nr:pyruvate, water dikinase regulatory protein [Candidatus Melainabacteria bacterium]
MEKSELTIYTLSDSSGETAELVARACLVQFPPGRASIYRLPQIKNVDQIPALVREIARERSIIAYTLVLPQYKEALEREAAKLNMATIDLLGPLIERISHVTGQIPLSQPGRLHILDESYFKRMEAVEFAIRYDDGKNPDGLAQADIILIGVSRTSKTPNCIYLAHHYGLKAANVPIVYGVDPPLALFSAPSKKIIGLNLDPYLLQEIRSTRAQILKMSSESDYADFERIQEEVKNARKLFSELNCIVIDVSGKAIEETSSEIYMHIRL